MAPYQLGHRSYLFVGVSRPEERTVVVGYISNHVSYNQDLGYLMNPYCLLAIYLVTYVDAPGDLA